MLARYFFPSGSAMMEDPATGSATANLGGWLLASGGKLPQHYEIAQGEYTGRPSTLLLDVTSESHILVSGDVVEIGRGSIDFELVENASQVTEQGYLRNQIARSSIYRETSPFAATRSDPGEPMTQRAASPGSTVPVQISSYDDMPFSQILFRYLWPFWLFKNAASGDRYRLRRGVSPQSPACVSTFPAI